MNEKRRILIQAARAYLNVKFSHQGRNRQNGMDCGGLVMVAAKDSNLSELEFLGYADFPHDGKFDELLSQNCESLDITSSYPHNFDGTEFLPGDLISYDYKKNDEGTRHIALISQWDGKCYHVINATNEYGVSEHPFRMEFARATITGWRIKGIDE